jgi:hypothetical protein
VVKRDDEFLIVVMLDQYSFPDDLSQNLQG